MGETVNGMRLYKCKRCGNDTSEPIYRWRKKNQNKKNICPGCISKDKLAKQTARERAEDMGYGGYSLSSLFHI